MWLITYGHTSSNRMISSGLVGLVDVLSLVCGSWSISIVLLMTLPAVPATSLCSILPFSILSRAYLNTFLSFAVPVRDVGRKNIEISKKASSRFNVLTFYE